MADLLRRAHLEDGVPWSEMAVLVRSGRTSIPVLRRGLAGAGVPVEVASDETPLVREPAVRPLLDALRAVVNLDNDDPDDADYLDPVAAEGLLVSPMVGLDATDVRTLSRSLRERDKQLALEEGRPPRPSPYLLREAVLGGGELLAAEAPLDPVVRRVVGVLGAAAHRPGDPRRLGHGGGGPLGAVVRHQLARAPARPDGAWGIDREAGQPRPRRDVCTVRDRRPRRGAGRPQVGRRVPRDPRAAGDPGRHPGGAWHPRRVGAPADGAPVQGAGVAAGRGRARAGDLVARPASTHEPAAGRPHRRRAVRRPGDPARDHHEGAARRGAPPVLRRLHPRRASGWWSRPSPRRTTRASSLPGSSPSSAWRSGTSRVGRPGRCRCSGWSASFVVRRRTPSPTRRSATPPCDDSPASRPSAAPTDAPSSRRRTRPPGGGPAT